MADGYNVDEHLESLVYTTRYQESRWLYIIINRTFTLRGVDSRANLPIDHRRVGFFSHC